MATRPLDLGRQSAVGRDPHMGVTRLVNLRAEEPTEEGQPWPLWAVSGLSSFASPTGGAVARMIETGAGGLVIKAGRVISAVDGSGTATVLGGMASDGLTTMARNDRAAGDQIMICCDGALVMIEGAALTVIADPDAGVPNSVFEVGGYFVTTEAGGLSRASELLDGSSWEGLAVEQIGRDLLIGAKRGRDACFFGSRALHIWTLNDGQEFPLSPRSSIGYGAWAAGAVVSANDTLYWLSTTDQGAYAGVRVLAGDNAQAISSSYVDRLVARETDRTAIAGTTWTEDGRTYIAWSGTDWTVVLDVKSGLWHERGSLIDGALTRWRVGQAIDLGGRVIAAAHDAATLYELSHTAYDEAGTELPTLLQTPPLTAYPGRVQVDRVHLDAVAGVGLATGAVQDTSPQVAMRWSRDGRTWSSELVRSLGVQGDTDRRVSWSRLGTSKHNGLTLQFRSSAAVVRGYRAAAWDGAIVA